MITRRQWLELTGYSTLGLLSGCVSLTASGIATQNRLIGYSRYQTNLPGGRYVNAATTRAWVVRDDGREPRPVAPELANKPDSWTQFAGWSPDGRKAIIGSGWESEENGKWEEEHKTFRHTEGWLYDMYLVDIKTGEAQNLTAVERVSPHNTGLFFIPGAPPRLGFQAMIGDKSHPFVMDLDGRNKRDLTTGDEGFTYGFNTSPDGRRVSYHKDYQVFLAEADGSRPQKIETGNPFNFAPQWSPDGKWVMFVSGERTNCDPFIVRADGSGLRKVASRNGYKGWIATLDVYDFHEGSSDVPVWTPDSAGIYFTSQFGTSVELMWASLDGAVRQLTHSPDGTLHYHPKASPDGRSLAFGSTRTGTRQLYVRPADPRRQDGETYAITDVPEHHAAMWASWQP